MIIVSNQRANVGIIVKIKIHPFKSPLRENKSINSYHAFNINIDSLQKIIIRNNIISLITEPVAAEIIPK